MAERLAKPLVTGSGLENRIRSLLTLAGDEDGAQTTDATSATAAARFLRPGGTSLLADALVVITYAQPQRHGRQSRNWPCK